MIKILLIAFCFMLPLYATPDSLTVLLITFRGTTDAEKGFTDYFLKKKLPVRFVFRDCNNDKARVPEFIREIPAIKPDLIYAFGTTVALGLAGPCDTSAPAPVQGIPLVCNIIADPVGARLVKDPKSQGRDITGVCHIVPMAVQIKAVRSVLPLTTMGVVYNKEEKNSALMVRQLQAQGGSCGFKVLTYPVTAPKNNTPQPDLSKAVSDLAKKGARMIYLTSDSYIISHAGEITGKATELGLPVISATEGPLAQSGALLGIVSRYYNAGQFAGYKAEQILFNNIKARDIPMETLSRFSFIINMKTARKIGFVPPILALKFAEVITE